VGGFNPSEKYQLAGGIIPNIWKVIKFHGSSHHQPDMGWKSIEIYGKSLEKSRTHHHIPHEIS
jgi:hypothetical protein